MQSHKIERDTVTQRSADYTPASIFRLQRKTRLTARPKLLRSAKSALEACTHELLALITLQRLGLRIGITGLHLVLLLDRRGLRWRLAWLQPWQQVRHRPSACNPFQTLAHKRTAIRPFRLSAWLLVCSPSSFPVAPNAAKAGHRNNKCKSKQAQCDHFLHGVPLRLVGNLSFRLNGTFPNCNRNLGIYSQVAELHQLMTYCMAVSNP